MVYKMNCEIKMKAHRTKVVLQRIINGYIHHQIVLERAHAPRESGRWRVAGYGFRWRYPTYAFKKLKKVCEELGYTEVVMAEFRLPSHRQIFMKVFFDEE